MHNKCGLSSIRIKHLKWGKTHRIVSDLSPLIIAPPLILSEELGNGTEKNRNLRQIKVKFPLQNEKC